MCTTHANASNQLGSCLKLTAVRSLVFDDVNRLLWHGHAVAIAAPSDGPPTSLGVGAGVAGANPNRTLLSFVSLPICLGLSPSLHLSSFSDPCSTTRSFLPGVSSSERIIDRWRYVKSSSDGLISRHADHLIGLAFDETKGTNFDLLIALNRVDETNLFEIISTQLPKRMLDDKLYAYVYNLLIL